MTQVVTQEWVSLRAFARRLNVRLSAVQKAIESGRVTAIRRNEAGRLTAIEVHQATAQWASNTDPAQAARSGTAVQAPGHGNEYTPAEKAGATEGLFSDAAGQDGHQEKPTAGSESPAGGGGSAGKKDEHGYLQERARSERFKAATAELEYLQRIGELVPTIEVREAEYERSRVLRDKLLNIPDRIATVVAAICERSDKAPQVNAAIAFELKQVLHELSDFGQALAAGGVGERAGDPVGDVRGSHPAGPGSDGVAVGGQAPGPVV